MNKRLLFLCILAVLFVAGGVICSLMRSGKHAPENAGAELSLLCTTYPVWLFAKAVTQGSGIEPGLLIPAGAGCPHDYALTPQDLMRISGKNILLIRNGAGLDDGICETVVRTAGEGRIAGILDCSAGIGLIPSEEECCHHHGEAEHGEHEHGHGFNAHIFASPDTAAQMVKNMADGLVKHDPAHAELYQKNAAAFITELSALSGEYINAGLRGKTIAVQHDVFAYLARLCGLREAVSLHAEENQSPSPAVIAQLKKTIQAEKVQVLFSEPQYPHEFAELLAKETGIRHAVMDPCATGPADAGPDYYTGVMRRNLTVLKEQFGK